MVGSQSAPIGPLPRNKSARQLDILRQFMGGVPLKHTDVVIALPVGLAGRQRDVVGRVGERPHPGFGRQPGAGPAGAFGSRQRQSGRSCRPRWSTPIRLALEASRAPRRAARGSRTMRPECALGGDAGAAPSRRRPRGSREAPTAGQSPVRGRRTASQPIRRSQDAVLRALTPVSSTSTTRI
jgi:hypothetical protein